MPEPSATDPVEVAFAVRTVIGSLRRALQAQPATSPGDLTPSQIAVVRRLEANGATTVSALAREEGVRSQSMGATVASLEALGHVVRQPDPSDGRQSIVSLEPAYAAQFRAGRVARNDWLAAELAKSLSPSELQELSHAMTLLRRITPR